MAYQPKTRLGRVVNEFEETAIAVMLGLMTIITFVNVIARYVFNSNILWQLEATVFLFAWLVLFGVSYCVKITAHLGVDVIVNEVGPTARKVMGLVSVAVCLAFCLLMLKGGWDYWHRFATRAGFLEVNDIPMPFFLQFLADITNDGEPYEKMPRYIPYLILPLSMALLTFRFLEAGWRIVTDETDRVIASHEAEELVEEAAEAAAEEAAREQKEVLLLNEGFASREPLVLGAAPQTATVQAPPDPPVKLDAFVKREPPAAPRTSEPPPPLAAKSRRDLAREVGNAADPAGRPAAGRSAGGAKPPPTQTGAKEASAPKDPVRAALKGLAGDAPEAKPAPAAMRGAAAAGEKSASKRRSPVKAEGARKTPPSAGGAEAEATGAASAGKTPQSAPPTDGDPAGSSGDASKPGSTGAGRRSGGSRSSGASRSQSRNKPRKPRKPGGSGPASGRE